MFQYFDFRAEPYSALTASQVALISLPVHTFLDRCRQWVPNCDLIADNKDPN